MSESAITTQIEELESKALDGLQAVFDLEALDDWRISFLGRRGELTQILRGLGSLPADERPAAGAAANAVRQSLQQALSEREDAIKRAASESDPVDAIDVTLPGWPAPRGGIHPTTQDRKREICAAFASMGFSVVEGPEIEWDHYNFEMLNIPKDHPARDMWDTLWIDYEDEDGERPMLLRTHTSPMQARTMEATDPPVRVSGARKVLPLRGDGPKTRVALLPDRGARRGQGHHDDGPQGNAVRVRAANFRRGAQGALQVRLLPVRRAGC